jgi:competence protein ComEC
MRSDLRRWRLTSSRQRTTGAKIGHNEDAVKAMSPDVVICSVGEKPSTDASDQYASHGADLLSTRFHGTITVTIKDNGKVVVANRKGEQIAKLRGLY